MSTTMTPEREMAEGMLQRPPNFGYFGGNEEMFKTWAMTPIIEHRDSEWGVRQKAKRLLAALEKRTDWSGQWTYEEASHWAVGWVKHVTFRVLDDDGKVTDIARFIGRRLGKWWEQRNG